MPPSGLTPVAFLEGNTGHAITVSSALTPSTLSKCRPQGQSPLFTLPAEIREIIFSLATAPCYAPESLLDEADKDYRPGHQGRRIISTTLLATCRRVWLETNHMPMQQAHHCFHLPSPGWHQYSPPASSTADLDHFSAQLTPNNRQVFQYLHIFANLSFFRTHTRYVLEPLLSSTGVCPEILTVTARHIDWPGWEHRSPLHLYAPGEWIFCLLTQQASPRLREVRLELETLQAKVDSELRPIVNSIRAFNSPITRTDELGNHVIVQLQPEETVPERTWSGAALGAPSVGVDSARTEYRILTLVWKVRPEAVEEVMPGVPGFAFDALESKPLGVRAKHVVRRIQIEERWERERSLLQFVD